MADWLEVHGAVIRVRVRALPRASRTETAGSLGDRLKVRLASPPVDGAANDELIRFVAKAVGLPRSAVTLVSGASSRNKLIEIAGIDAARIRSALGGSQS